MNTERRSEAESAEIPPMAKLAWDWSSSWPASPEIGRCRSRIGEPRSKLSPRTQNSALTKLAPVQDRQGRGVQLRQKIRRNLEPQVQLCGRPPSRNINTAHRSAHNGPTPTGKTADKEPRADRRALTELSLKRAFFAGAGAPTLRAQLTTSCVHRSSHSPFPSALGNRGGLADRRDPGGGGSASRGVQ